MGGAGMKFRPRFFVARVYHTGGKEESSGFPGYKNLQPFAIVDFI